MAFSIMFIIGMLFSVTLTWEFPGDTYHTWHSGDVTLEYGPIHMAFIGLTAFTWVVFLFMLFFGAMDDTNLFDNLYDDHKTSRYNDEDREEFEIKTSSVNYKKWIKWVISLLILYGLFHFGSIICKDNVKLYNYSKKYKHQYIQKVQEKLGFYDKLWKTYLQKDKITNINKETFIEVTKIIMENRADGENVTWKWLQENQNIPYSEFTVFYKDLSQFIETQREGYFAIERQCQEIAKRNNIMIDTFPNNIYNRLLKIEEINFEYGLLSDSTNNVFKTGIENIK